MPIFHCSIESVTTALNLKCDNRIVARVSLEHPFSDRTHRQSQSQNKYISTQSMVYYASLYNHIIHCKLC